MLSFFPKDTNGARRKPVRIRRGPATVRGPDGSYSEPASGPAHSDRGQTTSASAITPLHLATGSIDSDLGRRVLLPRARRPVPFVPAIEPLGGRRSEEHTSEL